MAKAEDIDIDPYEPYGLAAARIVRIRADELFAASGDVLDTSDIERVHAMRVATRRLRAVLEIFAPAFPRAEHRAVLREVKRLADALRSEEHTSELQSRQYLVCRLLLEKNSNFPVFPWVHTMP